MADFIASENDYIGVFACTSGPLVDKFASGMDDYNSILLKSIADRLAEALAEKLHSDVRRDFWSYAKNEELTPSEMIMVKYQGIRPAPGYPTQPDLSEADNIVAILSPAEIGIELTENKAMSPAASVSGLYFASDKSKYFQVGNVCKDQIINYASRKNVSVEEVEKWLSQNLSYERNL